MQKGCFTTPRLRSVRELAGPRSLVSTSRRSRTEPLPSWTCSPAEPEQCEPGASHLQKRGKDQSTTAKPFLPLTRERLEPSLPNLVPRASLDLRHNSQGTQGDSMIPKTSFQFWYVRESDSWPNHTTEFSNSCREMDGDRSTLAESFGRH